MGHPFLREENIVARLEALNREDALERIVDALPSWALRGMGKQKILELLLLREQVGTTAIGHGIALPHCFSPAVFEPIMAFGVSSQGVAYPSLDGRPVHFIFMLILPQNERAERLKRRMLQNIKWILLDRAMRERLMAARNAAEICQWIVPEAQNAPAVEL